MLKLDKFSLARAVAIMFFAIPTTVEGKRNFGKSFGLCGYNHDAVVDSVVMLPGHGLSRAGLHTGSYQHNRTARLFPTRNKKQEFPDLPEMTGEAVKEFRDKVFIDSEGKKSNQDKKKTSFLKRLDAAQKFLRQQESAHLSFETKLGPEFMPYCPPNSEENQNIQNLPMSNFHVEYRKFFDECKAERERIEAEREKNSGGKKRANSLPALNARSSCFSLSTRVRSCLPRRRAASVPGRLPPVSSHGFSRYTTLNQEEGASIGVNVESFSEKTHV